MGLLRQVAVVWAILFAALGHSAAAAGFDAYRPTPAYDGEQVRSFYLPMRDGVRIAIAIHRPANGDKPVEGRFPVVWHNTLDIGAPPGGGGALISLVRHGYVVAIVARRGNGASFGSRRGYEDLTESFDAYEVNEWLARQPWSTGQVGLYGCSNTGEAALHALKMRPPHLKAAYAGCFSWDRYDGHTRGGIIAQYGTGPTRTVEQDMRATPVDGDTDRKLLRQAAEEHQKSTDLFALMKSMPYRDSWSPLVISRFWGEVSLYGIADMVRQGGVPLYIQGGWYDDFRREAFVALDNLPGQARVIIGPWRHCRTDGFDMTGELLRFYDHYLKGLPTGIEDGPTINYFTVNAPAGHEWRSTSIWPLPGTREQTLFLVDGRLRSRTPKAGGTSFTANYASTCPPDPQEGGLSPGPFTQPCHNTGGVVFRGAPLAADMEITGHPIAELSVSADRSDAHVFVYLEDVAPDGSVRVVTEGRLKASLRKLTSPGWKMAGLPWHRSYAEDAEPLIPGQPAKLVIDLLPTSWIFKKGHLVQVVVSGSDPRERNRLEGPPPRLTVHAGGEGGSRLRLPVLGPA